MTNYEEKLWDAVEQNDVLKFSLILKHIQNIGGHLDIWYVEKKQSILMHTIRCGRVRFMKMLIDAGATVDFYKDSSDTALMYATMANNVKALQILINAGADVNRKDAEDWTAIMWATVQGLSDVVRILLSAHANPDIQYYDGDTALIRILRKAVVTDKQIETAMLLVEATNDINLQGDMGNTALINAALFGRVEVVKCLLNAGADPHIRADDGETALDKARRANHQDIVELLEMAMDNLSYTV